MIPSCGRNPYVGNGGTITMGTRHLIAVQSGGEYKVAQYGQWDGYPSGQGVDILRFLKNVNRTTFCVEVSKLKFYTSEEYAELKDTFEGTKVPTHLSRDTSADILQMIVDGKLSNEKLYNSIDFAGDSLFCEWCYVINLDDNTLEVFAGFNQEKLDPSERFADFDDAVEKYRPVKFKASWSLEALPDEAEFVTTLDPPEEEES